MDQKKLTLSSKEFRDEENGFTLKLRFKVSAPKEEAPPTPVPVFSRPLTQEGEKKNDVSSDSIRCQPLVQKKERRARSPMTPTPQEHSSKAHSHCSAVSSETSMNGDIRETKQFLERLNLKYGIRQGLVTIPGSVSSCSSSGFGYRGGNGGRGRTSHLLEMSSDDEEDSKDCCEHGKGCREKKTKERASNHGTSYTYSNEFSIGNNGKITITSNQPTISPIASRAFELCEDLVRTLRNSTLSQSGHLCPHHSKQRTMNLDRSVVEMRRGVEKENDGYSSVDESHPTLISFPSHETMEDTQPATSASSASSYAI